MSTSSSSYFSPSSSLSSTSLSSTFTSCFLLLLLPSAPAPLPGPTCTHLRPTYTVRPHLHKVLATAMGQVLPARVEAQQYLRPHLVSVGKVFATVVQALPNPSSASPSSIWTAVLKIVEWGRQQQRQPAKKASRLHRDQEEVREGGARHQEGPVQIDIY